MKVFIGIDPGVSCGFALYKPATGYLWLETFTFWELIQQLTSHVFNEPRPVVYIEDPRGNKPVFFRGLTIKKNNRVAQNVGSNKRDAALIIEWCRDHGFEVVTVTPNSRSLTKLTAEQFNKMTGYEGRSSQHARDAACIVWGLK